MEENSMLHLDHYDMFSQNFFETAYQIDQETGLGNYDGGFFPTMGFGTKMIPLGGDQFLEVTGFIDTEQFKLMSGAYPFAKFLMHRASFFLWSFRTDTLAELEDLARECGWEVDRDTLGEEGAQMMMNGHKVLLVETPKGFEAVEKGMPNIYWWPDMNDHDSRFPVAEGTGDGREPQGVAWIEIGGTANDLESWFKGTLKAKDYPIRFNGKTPGLYAIGVATSKGEVEIRKPNAWA
jgi:hypothetical protein